MAWAARGVVRRESVRWAVRFAGGFALCAALCFGAGCLTGRGASAWPEFAHNLEKHRGTWLTNNVGARNLVLYGRETVTRSMVDFSIPEPWSLWQVHMDRLQRERAGAVAAVAALLLALVGVAAWRASPDEAAVLGPITVFAAVLLTCYYWVMLVAVPFRRGVAATVGVLSMSVALFALDLATPSFEMIYGAMSWALAAVFVAWTAPEAVAAWRAARG